MACGKSLSVKNLLDDSGLIVVGDQKLRETAVYRRALGDEEAVSSCRNGRLSGGILPLVAGRKRNDFHVLTGSGEGWLTRMTLLKTQRLDFSYK